MPQSQPINSSQVDGLSSQFQRRWEAGFHWRSMCSMLLGTPALRAAWPMSSVDYQQPECTDISGHGHHLGASAALGNVDFGFEGIAPVALFGGAANQYLTKADGGAGNWADIIGTENYIIASQLGMTLGGWFWFPALPGAVVYLIGKDDAGANRQYQLRTTAANLLDFLVWPGPVQVLSGAALVTGWNHCVGIYHQPNQDLSVVLNGTVATNAGAAPAALADTGAAFTIGANAAGGNLFTGFASDCFLSASLLTQGFVRAGYHYTKAAFGVK